VQDGAVSKETLLAVLNDLNGDPSTANKSPLHTFVNNTMKQFASARADHRDLFEQLVVLTAEAVLEDKGIAVQTASSSRGASSPAASSSYTPFEVAEQAVAVAEREAESSRPPKRKRKECELGPARWARRQERARRFQAYMAAEEQRWNNMTAAAAATSHDADQALWDDPEI
jgi:hypothetical protein